MPQLMGNEPILGLNRFSLYTLAYTYIIFYDISPQSSYVLILTTTSVKIKRY
jgi:hypothetical protein